MLWLAIVALMNVINVHAATPPNKIVVGRLTLTRCNDTYNGYCGQIVRPFDPITHKPGIIHVGFEYYPRTDQSRPALGTIMPQEGGPGYSSTGTRDAYLTLFAPLRDRRDIIIIDKRGTGLSDPINCPALQESTDADSLAACAKQLGGTAWYYGTALAAADAVAVLDALNISRVDYYGDSYGTYFGQTLAARFPTRVRSIVLDGAYPVRPKDEWFPTDWATARDGFDLACQRSSVCRNLGERSTRRLTRLLTVLRQNPISGKAPDGDGVIQEVTLDVSTLFIMMFNAGNYPTMYRELDAAARAWFDDGDRRPLLRLVAEINTGGASAPIDYSAGLFTAVSCQEYPLLYKLSSNPTQRRIDYEAGLQVARQNRSGLFAPFTIDEAVDSEQRITPLDACLDWPAAPAGYAQGDALPAHPVFPNVPTLVLNGDLDAITSPQDGEEAARQFPSVTHIIVPNLTHITAYTNEGYFVSPAGADNTLCVSNVVLSFVKNLTPGDTSCIPKVRPIRTVPRFARWSYQVDPAIASNGNKAGVTELRIASAAMETIGDAIARYLITFGGATSGLRGGSLTFETTDTGLNFTLDGARWVNDLAVTGTVDRDQASSVITAQLALAQYGTAIGNLMNSDDNERNAIATLRGAINGKIINAQRIAP
ncbi:MAG: alpha/beta fold hydrolase [Gammaproteobacteria bacterium]